MIQWNKTKHNFGDIKAGNKYSATFEYESDDANLKIQSVKAGCHCTSSSHSSNEGTGKIVLTFEPARLSKQTKDLNLESYTSNKTATVKFNDGSTQILKLTAQVYDRINSEKVSA